MSDRPTKEQFELAEQEVARMLAAHQHAIASILDHPSIYMGGPSLNSMRRAKMICEYLAAERLQTAATHGTPTTTINEHAHGDDHHG